jgi:CheY-like chemotaxis protein/anti-sigma regulatory factor (Ser/Thr protein kinase)
MTLRTNNEQAAARVARPRVLVVEDDEVSRSLLKNSLCRQGCLVAVAENAADAQEQLNPTAIGTFDCVVTDYRMPDLTGLDLLAWIKHQDPGLATIIVTAEGERTLIAESLRGGAVDFLDKPVDLEKLRIAVMRAVQQTWQQRRLADSASGARELGRVQERMLSAETTRGAVQVNVCFHPRHEAGGDFFSSFAPAPGRSFYLLTDVSGHDLEAAYVSAIFQGMVRGMLEQAAPVAEIFASFNRILLEDWNLVGAFGNQPAGIRSSVAACALLVDSHAQTATVFTHGTPSPIHWLSDGSAHVVGGTGGYPLGWFPDLTGPGAVQPITAGSSFCLWTDGLDDVAEQMGVTSLTLAWALQQAKSRGERMTQIESATDDILLADLHLTPGEPAGTVFRPLVLSQHHGEQSGAIDEFQALWRRCLNLAVPELPEGTLHDVLLASREALLNALTHGCGGHANRSACFQIACAPALQIVRVRVCDPGLGHDFSPGPERRADEAPAEGHRGLILINHLASRADFQNHGASVVMDFAWP